MPLTAEQVLPPIEVVLNPASRKVLEEKCREMPRAKDAYEALKWRLERDPEWGPLLPLRDGSGGAGQIRWAKTQASANIPTVCAIYRLEPGRATIVNLRISKPGYDPVL